MSTCKEHCTELKVCNNNKRVNSTKGVFLNLQSNVKIVPLKDVKNRYIQSTGTPPTAEKRKGIFSAILRYISIRKNQNFCVSIVRDIFGFLYLV